MVFTERKEMDTKTLEIRDSGTFIGALAIRMKADNETQAYYFRRVGYPADGSSIMLMCLSDGKATNDPYEWSSLGVGSRTMQVAHDYVLRLFEILEDGDVVDVEAILGERDASKVSERFTHV